MFKKSTYIPLIAILLIAISILACEKNSSNSNGTPTAYVDLYVNITFPSYAMLNSVGGWVYVNGGVRGILLYRKSVSEFIAYERNCTYQPNTPCATVFVDVNGLILRDTCCGSKFLITDGSVNQTPATIPLTRYQTTFDGNEVHIFN